MNIEVQSINLTKVIIKNSSIDGKGLFAITPIKAGEIAVRWTSAKIISSSEYEQLPQSEKHFIDFQNGKIFLVGEPERYVNHSCDPNTIPGNLCDIASRDIAVGEEITTDYRNFFIPSGQFQCHCGSSVCRALIKGRITESINNNARL